MTSRKHTFSIVHAANHTVVVETNFNASVCLGVTVIFISVLFPLFQSILKRTRQSITPFRSVRVFGRLGQLYMYGSLLECQSGNRLSSLCTYIVFFSPSNFSYIPFIFRS